MDHDPTPETNRDIELRADGQPIFRLDEPIQALVTDEPARYMLVDVVEGRLLVWSGTGWVSADNREAELASWAMGEAELRRDDQKRTSPPRGHGPGSPRDFMGGGHQEYAESLESGS